MTMSTPEQQPQFATNRHDLAMTVGGEVNKLFRVPREKFAQTPPIAIATAYINPAGFALLADELEAAPRVRLLIGAEPEEDSVRAITAGDSDQDARRDTALANHEKWLEAERDTMGFARVPSAQAKRLVDWLRSVDPEGAAKIQVRRYGQGFLHGKAYISDDGSFPAVLAGSSNFTFAGLSLNAELNLGHGTGDVTTRVKEWFEHFWEMSDPYDLAELYGRLWDPHTPWSIYLRMLWELYGEHLDEEEPNFRTGLSLTRFQADGVLRMERLLDEHGGVLVADEVGLGKTFLAGEVIYRTANLNRQRVLIVAPAALKSSMWEPFLERHDFSRWVRIYSYEEVRNKLEPTHPDNHAFLQEIEDYSLVVVDEAHNLRNSGAQRSGAVDRVITAGSQPKRVVLLTATPVNNSLTDLETLVRYFIRDDARFTSIGIPSIHDYIQQAQAIDPTALTPEHLFDLMDQVAVRRTRKFVKEHYATELITGPDGKLTTIKFPQPKVRRIDYDLDSAGLELVDRVVYALDDPSDPHAPRAHADRALDPKRLMLARYLSSAYTLGADLKDHEINNVGLLRSALLKRLESSPQALSASLGRMITSHEAFLSGLDRGYVLTGEALADWVSSDSDDLDAFVADLDDDQQPGSTAGYHLPELRADVESDLTLLTELQKLADSVVDGAEPKVAKLVEELTQIAEDARRVDPRGLPQGDRRKVIIFSAFTDTVVPIHRAVVGAIEAAPSSSPLADYKGRIAPPIMGAYEKTHVRGASGGVDQGGRASTIAGFAPETAGPRNAAGAPTAKDEYDILFTTDVLAEGVNLQQAGQMINYDLPWNPMRIVQRHGRVDRIGSKHDYVYLGLFFPSQRLDSLLALEERLERKLALADAAVGAGEVLPGRGPGHDVNLADSGVIDEFEKLLDTGGSSASLSGEEYRRRLFSALDAEKPMLRNEITSLPYGSGSGFESGIVHGNGYVFCVKIGTSPKPWFRYVPADDDWSVRYTPDGAPVVSEDTLIALRVADPQTAATVRWLPDYVYDKAFDAWEIARDSVYATWTELTDPNSLQPDIPLSFRDAYALVVRAGAYLGDDRIELLRRLSSVPSAKVARAMRGALNAGQTDEQRITLVTQVLDDAGIVPPPLREPLPAIEEHEVRLVAWMAVRGTRGANSA